MKVDSNYCMIVQSYNYALLLLLLSIYTSLFLHKDVV